MAQSLPPEAQHESSLEKSSQPKNAPSPEVLQKRREYARTYQKSIVSDRAWEQKKTAPARLKGAKIHQKTEAELRYERTLLDDERWEKIWNGEY
jgi:hypothetical protein